MDIAFSFSCSKVVLLASALPCSTFSMRGPATAPGKMALERMLYLPNSKARVFAKPIKPHFAVAYGLLFSYPKRPAKDDIVRMTPAFDFFRWGMEQRVTL